MAIRGQDPALLRIGTSDIWDEAKFFESLKNLKSASHSVDIWFSKAPIVVSCVTSIAYIIRRATQLHLAAFESLEVPRILSLPYILQSEYNARIVSVKKPRIWDLVFYFRNKIYDVTYEKYGFYHMGMIIDTHGTFYHSTDIWNGYTESNLFMKIQEWHIATAKRLRENK